MEITRAYKHCPRCGSKIEWSNGMFACASCDLHFYDNPKPVTSVILRNPAGEFLFVERGVEPRKGYWDFPGGFLEVDEDFETSARREIKEELGVDIGELEYLSSHIDTYDYRGITYRIAGICFIGIIEDVELKPADDVSGFKFFKIDNFPMDRLASPSMQGMIEKLIEREKI